MSLDCECASIKSTKPLLPYLGHLFSLVRCTVRASVNSSSNKALLSSFKSGQFWRSSLRNKIKT